MPETSVSARAKLIKTRQGTWIDRSLLPAARQECLEILRTAAREAAGEDAENLPAFIAELCKIQDFKALELESEKWYRTGALSPVTETEILNLTLDSLDRRGVLDRFIEVDLVYGPSEELHARKLARKARATAACCGCCDQEFTVEEPAYLGADVYVGIRPLSWDYVNKPQFCKLCYERTVLCESCAPEWLSPERDDVTIQLCAHCERPMVSRLKRSELRRTFCSDSCQQHYHNRLRKEKRAEAREKVCEVCGEEFTATRQDAKTCSPGCKQKAYRRREREVDQNL